MHQRPFFMMEITGCANLVPTETSPWSNSEMSKVPLLGNQICDWKWLTTSPSLFHCWQRSHESNSYTRESSHSAGSMRTTHGPTPRSPISRESTNWAAAIASCHNCDGTIIVGNRRPNRKRLGFKPRPPKAVTAGRIFD